jgi:hypothetical protein
MRSILHSILSPHKQLKLNMVTATAQGLEEPSIFVAADGVGVALLTRFEIIAVPHEAPRHAACRQMIAIGNGNKAASAFER